MFSLREVAETLQLLVAKVDGVHTGSLEDFELLFLVNEKNFIKTVKFFVEYLCLPGANFEEQVAASGTFEFPISRLSKLTPLERLNVLHRLCVCCMTRKLQAGDFSQFPNLSISPSSSGNRSPEISMRLHAAMRRFKTTLAVFFRKSEKPDALWKALSEIPIAVPANFETKNFRSTSSIKKLRIGAVPGRGGLPDGYSKTEISRDVQKANLALKGKNAENSRGERNRQNAAIDHSSMFGDSHAASKGRRQERPKTVEVGGVKLAPAGGSFGGNNRPKSVLKPSI